MLEGRFSGPDMPILDPFSDEVLIGYGLGPPYGEKFVTAATLDEMRMSLRDLRQVAFDHLDDRVSEVEVHGQRPVLTLSFHEIESSLLLTHLLWPRLVDAVDGDLVVGAPARDVVFVTGAESAQGVAKVQRACERVFFAGGPTLLSPQLLVRRETGWLPL